MDPLHLVFVGAVIFGAGLTQSIAGFGYALFATPLLIWLGMELPAIIVLVGTCSMFQALIGARKLRAAVPWRLALTATAFRLASLMVGLFVLKKLITLSPEYIKLAVGGILCLLVVVQFFWRVRPAETVHWVWGGLAFTASGLLTGVCGMGGPPLVLWALAHKWSSERTRGFLFAVFATAIPLQIVLLCLIFGEGISKNVVMGIMFVPVVYLGTVVGLPLGNRLSKEELRRIVSVILLIFGLSSMAPAIIAHFH